ncbi:MAG: class I SAM-dependent methyltransferase [Terriglobales bacterium]
MPAITEAQIAEELRSEDLDEWLRLWRTEQGPAKPGSLELMAAAIPFAPDKNLHVLDLGCGPGDAGRVIASRFPNARTDFVDRDLFFISLCAAVNQRDGIHGRTLVRDLSASGWRRDFQSDYDVVVAANSLHWFSLEQAAQLFADIFVLLRRGGSFLFMEPVSTEAPFASGFARWRNTQPSQHRSEDWINFWSRVNRLLGYDYIKAEFGERDDQQHIGDRLTVMGWVRLLKNAGFESADILLRDPEKVVLAALKPRDLAPAAG